MEIKILHELSHQPQQSIAELSQKLKLSSIAILQKIAQINQQQPELVSNRNGKYSLTATLDWLDESKLKQFLLSQHLPYNVHLLSQTASTNSYALNHINQLPDKTIISCDWQFAGRGRFGRQWLSTIAHDITASLIYVFPKDYNLSVLPLLCAVAINRLFKNHSLRTFIKWPNDIYFENKKIAGVLVENLVRNQYNHTVVGIGLDNFTNLPRNQLLVELVSSLDNLLQEFAIFGFPFLRREWLDNCLHLHKPVTILQNNEIIARGIHQDITDLGELVIATEKGRQIFASSAISLRFEI